MVFSSIIITSWVVGAEDTLGLTPELDEPAAVGVLAPKNESMGFCPVAAAAFDLAVVATEVNEGNEPDSLLIELELESPPEAGFVLAFAAGVFAVSSPVLLVVAVISCALTTRVTHSALVLASST